MTTSKLPEKAADGNVPHVRQLQRFQNICHDDVAHKFLVLIAIIKTVLLCSETRVLSDPSVWP